MFPLIKNDKGSIIVLAAVTMTVLILFAAISIDVSYMLTARNQMQRAVDASALAAASGLTVNQSTAIARAVSISNVNTIMQQPLDLQSSEITFLNYKTVSISAQRTVSLFFASLAGLNTVTISARATAQCGNRDIMLVFDRSESMDDDTIDPLYPQPISGTKEAAYSFIDQVEANNLVLDRVGLVSYSDNAKLARSLGRDFAQMKNTIANYDPDGYTNIGDGIKKAKDHLNSNSLSKTKKTIILFSDGMANRPGSGMPSNQTAINYAISQANSAKSSQIRIYTISLGTETDPNLMQQIASITNGQYYYAPTPAELYAIFQEIARRIPSILIG